MLLTRIVKVSKGCIRFRLSLKGQIILKLNCDVGEGAGSSVLELEAQLMPYLDMANIACGFHASNPQIMSDTVALALKHRVSIGAHPGYPDRPGFGRIKMELSNTEIENLLLYQVGALQAICHAQGATVDYIKPHGALYHAMMTDNNVFSAIMVAKRKRSGESEKLGPFT